MHDVIEQLAKTIRARYCAEYRRWEEFRSGRGASTYGAKPLPTWDGGVSAFGRRHAQPVWPRLARFFLQHQIDHDLLIEEMFYERVDERLLDFPRPTYLMSEAALGLYAQALPRRREHIQIVHRADCAKAAALFRLKKRDDPSCSESILWRRVLLDPMSGFSPLFRYCLARSVGVVDLAERYHKEAFWQYIRSPRDYDEAMSAMIPRELREEAASVHEATLLR